MEMREFEKMTGFYPTAELYKHIEAAYYDFNGKKREFCKAYKENTDGLAERIQRAADAELIKSQDEAQKAANEYEATIARLSANLEREQEWKAYIVTDRVDQLGYTRLETSSGTKMLTDEEAKDLLYDWYGFAKEKVEILKQVQLYEISRHRELRAVGELNRHPLYNSTDWHYIRFKCGCMYYELYNDNLNQVSM